MDISLSFESTKFMTKHFKRTAAKLSIISLVLLFISLLFCNYLVNQTAQGKTFDNPKQTPAVKVGLLLGTGKYLPNGTINSYYKNRIDAAISLFHEQKIKAIVISGDNSREGYDEPTDMRLDLMRAGIDSNAIFLDYAGFRTFDSMVRLKEIFGQDSALIISQKFHNQRAIYIGEKLGLVCYGYNAADVDKFFGLKTQLREKLARVKVVIDFMLGIEPKFLGEKVLIL